MSRPRLVYITTIPLSLGVYEGHYSYFKSRGYEVIAVSSPDPYLDYIGTKENIEVRTVKMARRMAPLQDVVSVFRLLFLLLRLRPSIIQVSTPKAGLLVTIAARLTGVKTVLSVFGLVQMTQRGAMRRLLDTMQRIACTLANRVWTDSFSLRDYMVEQRLCSPRKIFVAGKGSVHGVDATGRFDPARFDAAARARTRAAWNIPENAFVIGFVGRIVKDKGLHELTEAWSRLRAMHDDVHLLLVGDPEDVDPISPEADRALRSDERVHFTGQQHDVPPLFAAMDLYVMPSYREGFGITNIEAAALALPVVSTQIPGCVDSVVDGVTGTLVPPRDADALFAAIERYYADPELRARHGAAGRARVLADFRPERIFEEVAAVYEALLK